MLKVDYLKLYKFSYYTLGPIFKNKGTLKGTYSVLKNIFGGNNGKYKFWKGQLSYKKLLFNNGKLILINGDKKMVNIL